MMAAFPGLTWTADIASSALEVDLGSRKVIQHGVVWFHLALPSVWQHIHRHDKSTNMDISSTIGRQRCERSVETPDIEDGVSKPSGVPEKIHIRQKCMLSQQCYCR